MVKPGALKILIAHTAYQQRGGEDAVVEAESALLSAAGHQVIPYLRHNDELAGQSALRNGIALLWSRRTVAEIDQLIARCAPDVIHVHNTFPQLSPALYWAAARRGVPVVQTLHNFRLLCPQGTLLREGRSCHDCVGRAPLPAIRHRCYRDSGAQSAALAGMLMLHRGLGSFAHKVDRYIALSEFCRHTFIQGGLPAHKLVVKPNFTPDPGPPPEAPRQGSLYVGRLSPEKGIASLLAAAARAPEVPLQTMGDGPMAAEVRQLLGARHLGPGDRAAVVRAMRAARYVVVPSICQESFGLSAIEAFACATPVIAARSGALPELVEEGHTGLLYTPGDAGDLARAVRWAEANPEQMRRMGEQARQRYHERYSPAANLAQLETLYRTVIGERA